MKNAPRPAFLLAPDLGGGGQERYRFSLVFSIDVEIGIEGEDGAAGMQLSHANQTGIGQ